MSYPPQFRITMDMTHRRFRVEQIDQSRNYMWRTISTHINDDPWEAYMPAVRDMRQKYTKLRELAKLDQHRQRMAQIKANNPYG